MAAVAGTTVDAVSVARVNANTIFFILCSFNSLDPMQNKQIGEKFLASRARRCWFGATKALLMSRISIMNSSLGHWLTLESCHDDPAQKMIMQTTPKKSNLDEVECESSYKVVDDYHRDVDDFIERRGGPVEKLADGTTNALGDPKSDALCSASAEAKSQSKCEDKTS